MHFILNQKLLISLSVGGVKIAVKVIPPPHVVSIFSENSCSQTHAYKNHFMPCGDVPFVRIIFTSGSYRSGPKRITTSPLLLSRRGFAIVPDVWPPRASSNVSKFRIYNNKPREVSARALAETPGLGRGLYLQ